MDVTAPKKTQGCDSAIVITGVLTTNGAAGEIRYQWKQSDRKQAIQQTEAVAGKTSHEVSLRWTVKGEGSLQGNRHPAGCSLRRAEKHPGQGDLHLSMLVVAGKVHNARQSGSYYSGGHDHADPRRLVSRPLRIPTVALVGREPVDRRHPSAGGPWPADTPDRGTAAPAEPADRAASPPAAAPDRRSAYQQARRPGRPPFPPPSGAARASLRAAPAFPHRSSRTAPTHLRRSSRAGPPASAAVAGRT